MNARAHPAESPAARTARLAAGFTIMTVTIVAGLLLEGGHLGSLLERNQFLIVLGGVVTGFTMSGMNWGAAARGALFAGVIGNIMGMIHVMQNLDKQQSIGPGIAVAFVGTVFAGLAWAVCRGIDQSSGTATAQTANANVERDGEAIMASFTAMTLLLFAAFVVLYAINVAGK